MSNLADEIERFILRKLAGEQSEVIVLRRNELADELECAPSQISYVLSTRFSIQRGFIVESRRGSGGFVRIARIPVQNIVFEDAAGQIDTNVALADLIDMLDRLSSHGLITGREGTLLSHAFTILYRYLPPKERVKSIQALLLALRNDD